ncbi:ribonuclease P protein component [Candidatus Peribacteria bacterium]|nr:ribonuclease P protein component [Candidatus Peribacteria bacterium]
MLPKAQRLKSRQFAWVFRRGESLSTPHLFLKYAPSKYGTRLSCTVGKKHFRKAHERNAVRRQLYGALTPALMATLPPVSGVITWRGTAAPEPTLLREELRLLLAPLTEAMRSG